MADNKEEAIIIDDICNYAESNHIKEMLQEYLRRIIVDKPKDPLNYLLATIKEKPYKPSK
jgi:hypothetical protein